MKSREFLIRSLISLVVSSLILGGMSTQTYALAPESRWAAKTDPPQDSSKESLAAQQFWGLQRASEEELQTIEASYERMRTAENRMDTLLSRLRTSLVTPEIQKDSMSIERETGIWITTPKEGCPRILLQGEDSRQPEENAIFLVETLSKSKIAALLPLIREIGKSGSKYKVFFWKSYFTLSQESGTCQTEMVAILNPLDTVGYPNPLSPNFKEDLRKNTFKAKSLPSDHIFRWIYEQGDHWIKQNDQWDLKKVKDKPYTAHTPISSVFMSELLTRLSVYDPALNPSPSMENKADVLNALRKSLFYSDSMPREIRRHFWLMIATFFWESGYEHPSFPPELRASTDIPVKQFYELLKLRILMTNQGEVPVIFPMDNTHKLFQEFLDLNVPIGTQVIVHFKNSKQRPDDGYFFKIVSNGNHLYLKLTTKRDFTKDPSAFTVTSYDSADIDTIQIPENTAKKTSDLPATSA